MQLMAIALGDSPLQMSLGPSLIGRISKGDVLVLGHLGDPTPPTPPGLSLVARSDRALSVTAFGVPLEEGFGAVVGYHFYLDGVKDTTTPHGSEYVYKPLDDGEEFSLTFTFVNAEDEESDEYGLLIASTLPSPPDPPMSPDDCAAIDLIVNQSMAAFPARPGLVLSITGPRGYYHRAYGRRAPGERAISLNDHMRMGSITKTFVAMAIWLQIQLGNLSLDDKLGDFITGIPRGNDVTIRHLLAMRSGVFDYSQYLPVQITNFVLSLTAPWSFAQALQIIRGQPSQFTPGTAYQYSNSNFVLLGRILEIVTGRPIRTVLKEDVIDPLGLTETSWPAGVGLPVPFARGFGANIIYNIILSIPFIGPLLAWLFGGPHREETYSNPQFFGAAGGMVTTVGDLTKFVTAQNDEQLLTEDTYTQWRSTFDSHPAFPWKPGPATFGYGLGLVRFGAWLGHDGSCPGFSSVAKYEPTSQATICLMENYQTPGILVFSRMLPRIADYLYPGSFAEDWEYEVPDPGPGAPPISYTGTVTDVEVPHETHTHYRTVLIGHGGGAGGGQRNNNVGGRRNGGSGGGGAAVIDTGIRPIAELGETFSQTEGTGGLPGDNPGLAPGQTNLPGNPGTAGTASTFTSDGIELIANGGGAGQGGPTSVDPAPGGAGGTAEVSGIADVELQADGTAGAPGSGVDNSPPAANNTAGGAAGGGGGAGNRSGDLGTFGSAGGNSIFQTGGDKGVNSHRDGYDTAPTAAGQPGAGAGGGFMGHEGTGVAIPGGEGGTAGGFGGGGGGGPAGRFVRAKPGGPGGPSYARTDFFYIEE